MNMRKDDLFNLNIGLNMAVGMAFFSIGGWWLDKHFLTKPVLTSIGIFLGLAYCAYEVWKFLKMTNDSQNNDT